MGRVAEPLQYSYIDLSFPLACTPRDVALMDDLFKEIFKIFSSAVNAFFSCSHSHGGSCSVLALLLKVFLPVSCGWVA